jgi:hypothetical protein
MPQDRPDHAPIETVAGGAVGTGLNLGPAETTQDLSIRQLPKVPHRRHRQAGRNLPGGIDRNAIPSGIARLKLLPSQPSGAVGDEFSEVPGRDQIFLEKQLEHPGGGGAVVHQPGVLFAVEAHVPVVGSHDGNKAPSLGESHDVGHLFAIDLAHDTGKELGVGILCQKTKSSQDLW